MADDIVTSLQQMAKANGCEAGRGCREAADEIERLRVENERLRAAGDALYELISVRLVIPADRHDDAVEQIRKWNEARRG